MAIEFDIFPEQKLLRAQLGETCDAESFQDYLARRDADPRFELEFRRLMDARRLLDLPTAEAMRGFVRYLETGNPMRVRIAFVASRDAAYGMFRMLEILSELKGYEHRAFRDLEEAEAWLGVGTEGNAEEIRTPRG
jgi:hypothetical protein